MRGEALPPLARRAGRHQGHHATAGIRTTWGSTLFADHVPTEDAEVVTRLKRAGASCIGKTNTPEFAAGGNTVNKVFGATRNPWNLRLSASGLDRRRGGGRSRRDDAARRRHGFRRQPADAGVVLRRRRPADHRRAWWRAGR